MQIRNRICARRTRESMILFLGGSHRDHVHFRNETRKLECPCISSRIFDPQGDVTADPGSDDTVAARVSNPTVEVLDDG